MMHLSRCEPGQTWIGETYRFDRFSEVSPGWELNQTWFQTEQTKGWGLGSELRSWVQNPAYSAGFMKRIPGRGDGASG